jgi:beta-lactamase regulating signal transducer with metallopeptidase domain/protocatechuate 3,4-dioxygenase beta subunit
MTTWRLATLMAAQVAAIIVLAWLLAATWGRRRPAIRHAIWLTSLAGVLLGPAVLATLNITGWWVRVVQLPAVQRIDPMRAPAPAAMVEAPVVVRTTQPAPVVRPVADPRFTRTDLVQVILAIWAAGSAILIVRLIRGLGAVERLRRNASPLAPDSRLMALLAPIARELGLSSVPELRVSSQLAGPVAAGIVRPVILLPESLATCALDDRLCDILAHEAAHLVRRDPLIGLLQRLAVAIHWPNPLVHLLSRELSRAREEVCDNHVLARDSASPTRYAHTLVDLAESIRDASPTLAAVGLLPPRPWNLADRVTGLLDERRDLMTCVTRRTLAALATLMLLAASPFVALGPVRIERTATAQTPPTTTDGPITADEIAGIVVDAQGRPLSGAIVDAYSFAPGDETTTDAEGRFRLRLSPNLKSILVPWLRRSEAIELRVMKEGYSPRSFDTVKGGTSNLRVELSDTPYYEGLVNGPDGRPEPGVSVWESHPRMIDGHAAGRVWTETQTGADGRFLLRVEPSTFDLLFRKPGVGVAWLSQQTIRAGQRGECSVTLQTGVTFEARVTDSQTGAPIEGIRLYRWLGVGRFDIEGHSGADGVVRIENLPPGHLSFAIEAPGYGQWWSPQTLSPWMQSRIGKEPSVHGYRFNVWELDYDLQPGMAPVSIVVEKAAIVRGRVLDPDGQPVAGATVDAVLSGTGASLTSTARTRVQTDADGTYEVHLPDTSDHDCNLMAHDGQPFEWRTWANGVTSPFRARAGQVVEGLNITLTRPATVSGRVWTTQNQPQADSWIIARSTDGLESEDYRPTATTDAQGRFVLHFLRPGEQEIRASYEDLRISHASQTLTVQPGQVVEPIELRPPATDAPSRPLDTASRQ